MEVIGFAQTDTRPFGHFPLREIGVGGYKNFLLMGVGMEVQRAQP